MDMETDCAPPGAITTEDAAFDDENAVLTAFWTAHGRPLSAVAAHEAGLPGPDAWPNGSGASLAPAVHAAIRVFLSASAREGRVRPVSADRLARLAARLLTEACKACDLERVQPDGAELHKRVTSRLGLDAASARYAGGNQAPPPRMAHAIARMTMLAEEVLGERERIVFLARTLPGQRARRPTLSLAQELGIDENRVREIERSARRKVAAALAAEGAGDVIWDL